LENTVEEEYLQINQITKDINTHEYGDDKGMFDLTFLSSNKRHFVSRKYMKLQDLLASIGGFFNFI
jgi:hypothetical protein